jgi:serpin B
MAIRLLALILCLCSLPLAAQPASSSDLALRLLRRRAADKNAALSPVSLQTAFAMAAAGAKGETRQEIVKGLALGNDFLESTKKLLKSMADDGAEVFIANRLWPSQNVSLLPSYVALSKASFGAEPVPLDYTRTEQARQTINTWVSENTKKKIPELLKPGRLDATTVLVLTNALYFKGAWKTSFDKTMTQSRPFQAPSKGIKVPMMHQVVSHPYFENQDLQAVRLDYKDSALAMTILVPKRLDGWKTLREKLDPALLEQILNESQPVKVDLSVPRFKVRSSLDMVSDMRSLGIEKAFGSADFSGITTGAMVIGQAIHEALVEVNEEGTVAAAATAVIATRSMSQVAVVVADRPFLFFISDPSSEAILFVGQVVDPESAP